MAWNRKLKNEMVVDSGRTLSFALLTVPHLDSISCFGFEGGISTTACTNTYANSATHPYHMLLHAHIIFVCIIGWLARSHFLYEFGLLSTNQNRLFLRVNRHTCKFPNPVLGTLTLSTR